jgi:hypothetical protein
MIRAGKRYFHQTLLLQTIGSLPAGFHQAS